MSKRNINRNAVKWNTLSGLINAGQSAVILVFISHFYDVRTAGTFTIAYAMANLFMTMGKYGVRNYQVTDIKNHFSFEEYHYQRILTVIGSFLILLAYLAFQYFSGGYSLDKTMIVLLVCLWKYVDAIEDVYYGMYQQQGRLDIGAKCYSLRLMASMLVMCVLLLLKVNFLITMIIVIIVSVILALVLIKASVGRFEVNHERYMTSILAITRICFPLFIGNSLSMFLGNSPKYLVDWYLDENIQAICGYLMMPSFVILILSQFIYQPIIRKLADIWQDGDKSQFIGIVSRQGLVIGALTVAIVIGGVVVGIPVLTILYNFDLSVYRAAFAIILAAGGIYAFVSFMMVPLTVIRFQNCIAYGFIIATAIVLLLGKSLLNQFGMLGAALIFLIQNIILALYLMGCFVYKVRQS